MAHTLRKVDKDFSFEEQRVELNELAQDVYNLKHDFDAITLDDLVDVTAAGAAVQQIIKFNGTSWVLDTDVVSTSFSVQTNAASGGGALSYDNSTAIFQYTPPDLSGLLTSLGSVGGHTDVDVTGAVNGKILKYNGTNWVVADDNTTAASAFVSLTDTPNSFTANKWIKVNSGGTALEWTDAPQTALSSINDINDVTITSAQNDQLLKWNGTHWINFTPGYLTSFTEADPTVPAHVKSITQANITAWNAKSDVASLNDLSDVTTGTIATGEVLKWNGSAWEALPDGGSVQSDWQQSTTSADDFIKNKPTLFSGSYNDLTNKPTLFSGSYNDLTNKTTIPNNIQDLSNVTITNPSNGQVLKWNGTAWINDTDVTGGGGGGGASVTVSDTAPSSPTAGDLWWKSDEGRLKIRFNDGDTQQWVDTTPIGYTSGGGGGGATVTTDDNAPSNPNDGDLWYKTDEGQLKVYYQDTDSSQWVDTGGGSTGIALTALSVGADNPAFAGGGLSYNNTNGVFTYTPPIIPSNLADLANVDSANPVVGMVLTWDGNNWGPDTTTSQVQSDWNQATTSALDFIKNKPSIPAAQVQSDWSATSGLGQILNKPTIPAGQVNSDWNANTGLAQILNKPSIPAAQIQSDWNQSATTDLDFIKNKPTLFSGNYNDLTNQPTIPTNTNQLTNGAGFLTTESDNLQSVTDRGNTTTTSITASGGVNDSSGSLREIINNSKTASYLLAATDVGELINTNSGVTVPQNVFSAGQAITIYNNTTTSNITITQGTGATMYLCGQATTGDRTLAKTGVCTVLCVAANTFVISGAGLS